MDAGAWAESWAALASALGPAGWAWAELVVALAFFVRGYSGFGSSLVAVTGLALVLAPATVVPALYVLEVVASLMLLPTTWRQAHWPSLRWMLAGCVLGTPVGVAVLAYLSVGATRRLVFAAVFVSALTLWRGFSLPGMPGRGRAAVAGALSGLLNGAVGVSGPPAIVLYFASPAAAGVSRASLSVLFLFTDAMALPAAGAAGLLTAQVLLLTVLVLPALLAGVWAGKLRFERVQPETFRRTALLLLMGLSAAGLLRELLG